MALSQNRVRVALWLAVLVSAAVVVLLWLALFQRAERAVIAAPREPSRPEPVARESTPRRRSWRAPVVAQSERRSGPTIERIDVDKSEVCYGEENFANVRAFEASGSTDRLTVRLSGTREMGFRLPFRIQKFDATRPRSVLVSGPGGAVHGEIPEVKVKDCEVAEQVAIDVRLAERGPHLLNLTASVSSASGAAGKFEPVSYEWDFGDGSSETTRTASVQHSYEGKPEKTIFSYFLMRVRVKDRSGREVSGSRAYGFTNFGFGKFVDEHRILVHTAGGSMPGTRAPDERIRLYHGYEGSVRLDSVRSIELDTTTNRELSSVEYSPQALLGVSELTPGKSISTRDLSDLRPSEPNRVRKIELVGRAGNIEARGAIVLSTAAKEPERAPAEVVSLASH